MVLRMNVRKLIGLLEEFPADFTIGSNALGNFLVYDGASQYHSYIDVSQMRIELFDEGLVRDVEDCI